MIPSQIYVKLSASKAPSLILPPLTPIRRNQASTQKSQKRRATEGAEVPGDPGGLLPVRAARGLPGEGGQKSKAENKGGHSAAGSTLSLL